MKQSLEQLIIAFTTESQLQSLAKNYHLVAKESEEKKIISVLENYIKEKESVGAKLLEIIQDVKDQIGEYSDDEWAVEVGGNFGIDDNYENIQYLLKMERYSMDVIYPECEHMTTNEGLSDVSLFM